MSILLAIVSVIGKIVLVLLAIILILLLIILFTPIVYQGKAQLPDLEGSEELEKDRLMQSLSAKVKFHWLLGLVGGSFSYPDDGVLWIRILWFRINLLEKLEKKDSSAEKKEKKEEKKEEPKNTDKLWDKLEKLYIKAGRWKKLLEQESTHIAIEKAFEMVGRILKTILPRKWNVEGTIGLGDPEKSAQILEAYSVLLPVIAGHVWIAPNFMQYQFDGKADAKGHICLISLVIAFLRFLLQKDVRLLMRRIRVLRRKNKEVEDGRKQ